MTFRLCALLLSLVTGLAGPAIPGMSTDYLKRDEAVPASSLRVSNNHLFPVREPVRFQLPADLAAGAENLLAVSHSVSGGTVEAHYLPVQLEEAPEGEAATAWIDVQLRPSESRVYSFQDVGGNSSERSATEVNESFPSGLPSRLTWQSDVAVELFDLSLLEIVKDLDKVSTDRPNLLETALASPLQASFELQEESHGPVKSTFTYSAVAKGHNDYRIEIRYDFYSSGTTDIEIALETTEARATRGYLAIAKRLISEAGETTALQSRGEIHTPVANAPASPNSSVNWFSWGEPGGESRAILAEISPNITRRHDGRHHAVNSPLIAETAINSGSTWFLLAEISREKLDENGLPHGFVLPEEEETVQLRYRLLPSKTRSLSEIAQAFTSFAGYQGRRSEKGEFHVSFGTPGVSFGNTYSPHSAHGENWSSFKDEIRRNMRIANALGVEWIRIQNISSPDSRKNFLTKKEGKWMLEYLDFMAETARDAGLNLYLGISLNPDDAGFLAKRLEDVVRFYEIEDNALAQGIPQDRLQQWLEVHDALKSARPNVSVVVTGGPESLALFDRLKHLGLPVDAVGQQLPEEDQTSSSRLADQAIALGGYATRLGKMPLALGDLWQRSPQDSEHNEALAFFNRCDALLSQRSIPLLLLADLAHPLRLDGTPTVQAQAYHELIRRYGHSGNRIKTIEIKMPLLTVRPGQNTALPVTVKNLGTRPLEVRLDTILPDGLTTDDGEESMTLRPRESRSVQRTIRADDDLAPGFYHVFAEAHIDDTVRLGWTFASHRAAPALDLKTDPANEVRYPGGLEQLDQINLSNLRHVVFGGDASDREIEDSLQLQNVLRRATGANIQRAPHDQVDENQKTRSVLLVGNQETNPFIAEIADRLPLNPIELAKGEGAVMVVEHPANPNRFILLISGRDASGIAKAAGDLIGRFGEQ